MTISAAVPKVFPSYTFIPRSKELAQGIFPKNGDEDFVIIERDWVWVEELVMAAAKKGDLTTMSAFVGDDGFQFRTWLLINVLEAAAAHDKRVILEYLLPTLKNQLSDSYSEMVGSVLLQSAAAHGSFAVVGYLVSQERVSEVHKEEAFKLALNKGQKRVADFLMKNLAPVPARTILPLDPTKPLLSHLLIPLQSGLGSIFQ